MPKTTVSNYRLCQLEMSNNHSHFFGSRHKLTTPYLTKGSFHFIIKCINTSKCLAGSKSLENILAPEKCSRGSSTSSISFIPRSDAGVAACQTPSMESSISSLELEVLESQAKCSTLISELSSSEHSRQIEEDMQQLHQKLESMQTLLTRLRMLI